jgi:hypothetical protein
MDWLHVGHVCNSYSLVQATRQESETITGKGEARYGFVVRGAPVYEFSSGQYIPEADVSATLK